MNCQDFEQRVDSLVRDELLPSADAECRRHASRCDACHDLLTGAEAMQALRARRVEAAPAGLSSRLVAGAVPPAAPALGGRRFWQGAAAGAAGAALVAMLLYGAGMPDSAGDRALTPASGEFVVALDEQRLMDLAIEADRPLIDARITIELTGGVELDGYGSQRTVEWTTDLKAGVNRLSLPVIANDLEGGRMVVRLSHPQSERLFVVRLKTEA